MEWNGYTVCFLEEKSFGRVAIGMGKNTLCVADISFVT